MSHDANRKSLPWRNSLTSAEAEELAKLEKRAARVDKVRRRLTHAMRLIHQRAAWRARIKARRAA